MTLPPTKMKLLDNLDRQLAETVAQQNATAYAPELARIHLAMNEQFKLTVESVASLGEEIHERIRRLEAGLAECHDVLRIIQEACDSTREKGTQVQLTIDETAATMKQIRTTVAELMKSLKG